MKNEKEIFLEIENEPEKEININNIIDKLDKPNNINENENENLNEDNKPQQNYNLLKLGDELDFIEQNIDLDININTNLISEENRKKLLHIVEKERDKDLNLSIFILFYF